MAAARRTQAGIERMAERVRGLVGRRRDRPGPAAAGDAGAREERDGAREQRAREAAAALEGAGEGPGPERRGG